MPFIQLDSEDPVPPEVKLELQKDSKNFKLLTGFRFVADDDNLRITVRDDEDTDLASIPFFLRWFVGTYGKHTRAAILHDHLWRKPAEGIERRGPEGQWVDAPNSVDKLEANLVFRNAMGEAPLDVSTGKRWVMWSAVTLDALRCRRPDQLLMYPFLALHLAMDVLLAVAVVDGRRLFGFPIWAALLLFPGALAALWPRCPNAGLIASYALAAFFVPSAAVLGVIGVFFVVEYLLVPVVWLWKKLRRDPTPVHGPSVTKIRETVLQKPPALTKS